VRADRRCCRCRYVSRVGGRVQRCPVDEWRRKSAEDGYVSLGCRRYSSERLHTGGDVDRVRVPFARSQLPSSTFPELRTSKADFATSGLARDHVQRLFTAPSLVKSGPVNPLSGATQCTTGSEMQTTCLVHASGFASCPSSGY
jgi:hypothetical protein